VVPRSENSEKKKSKSFLCDVRLRDSRGSSWMGLSPTPTTVVKILLRATGGESRPVVRVRVKILGDKKVNGDSGAGSAEELTRLGGLVA
jgi:hypothetical protein